MMGQGRMLAGRQSAIKQHILVLHEDHTVMKIT